MTTVSDEIVDTAERTYDMVAPAVYECNWSAMRAALEAVAPLLLAEGMREAAELLYENWFTESDRINDEIANVHRIILARAAELEAQK